MAIWSLCQGASLQNPCRISATEDPDLRKPGGIFIEHVKFESTVTMDIHGLFVPQSDTAIKVLEALRRIPSKPAAQLPHLPNSAKGIADSFSQTSLPTIHTYKSMSSTLDAWFIMLLSSG